MPERNVLHIVDGTYYIYRAYYALRRLSTSDGFPTNAIFGFVGMLKKLIADESPEYLIMTFDPPGRGFRKEIYPDYKANRQSMPDDLRPQLPVFREIVAAYNIPIIERPGFEADDVMGTLSKVATSTGFDVVLITGDKDLTQLVNHNVSLLDTMRDKRVGLEQVRERFLVEPAQVPDVLGLWGDTSDNIPGVPSVGEKTAARLIRDFGSIEGVLENLDKIGGKKVPAMLAEHRELAFLSRRLATIKTDLDVEFVPEAARLTDPNLPELAELFRKLEMSRHLDDLRKTYDLPSIAPDDQTAETAEDAKLWECLSLEDLEKIVAAVRRAGRVSVDTETTGLDPMRAHLVGISLSWTEGEGVYIPTGHTRILEPDQLSEEDVIARLKPILEDPEIAKVGQHLKYDEIVLARHGITLRGIEFDCLLASYVLDPTRRSHSMDQLAKDYLRYTSIKFKEVAGSGQGQLTFDQVPLEKATIYAAEDAEVTLRLAKHMGKLLDGEPDLRKLHDDLELPLSRVLSQMERHGVLLDREILRSLSREFERQIMASQEQIFEQAGRRFNVNSPKQLAVVLFEDLGLPVLKKTKSGPSTNHAVLEKLAEQHPIPRLILEYRSIAKLKNTYTDTLPKLVHPETGRIHTDYRQAVAATGRLSSNHPNLQNIPVRTAEGRRIREAFVAPPGMVLFGADYSQVELRLLAHMSGDSVLLDAFRNGEDIHARTAAEVFEIPREEVTREKRSLAKTINFGVLYGMGSTRLARETGLTRKEAAGFITRYFERMPSVRLYIDQLVAEATSTGYARTLLGRRRPLPELRDHNRGVRALGERLAVNTPVQGTAADIIKLAMVNVQRRLDGAGLNAAMLMHVHDELVFEVAEDDLDKLQSLVVEEMEGAFDLDVPLSVDVGFGLNWAALK
jgi:DNA polymerase-1